MAVVGWLPGALDPMSLAVTRSSATVNVVLLTTQARLRFRDAVVEISLVA